MPEGDTIRRMAASVESRFLGQTVRSSVFRHPRLATASLNGRQLEGADARGKHLLVRFDDGRTLHAHMLMQGRVVYRPAFEVPEWKRRFEFEFDAGRMTGIEVPKIELIPTVREERELAHLGPDVCGSYDHSEAVQRMRSAGGMALGAALLDQRIVAGFGNIYAVESPFICGLSPFQPVASIPDVERVVTVAAALIRANAVRGPQRTTGQARVSAEHWVLSGDRRRCLVCGSRVTRYRGSDTPWRRRTAVCPTCQPITTPRTVDVERVQRLLRVHPARSMIDLDSAALTVPTDRPVVVQFGPSGYKVP